MTREEIEAALTKFSPQWRVRALKRDKDLLTHAATFYPGVDDAGEIAYLFVNRFVSRPTCANCGGAVSWFGNRYATTCSTSCSNRASNNIERMRDVMRQKHGVDNAAALPVIQAKRLATMQERYGAKVSPNQACYREETWGRLNTKGRETLRERYNVNHPAHLPDHREKAKATLISRYGVDHPSLIAARKLDRHVSRVVRIQSLLPPGIILRDIIAPDKDQGEANNRYAVFCRACGTESVLPSETFKFRLRKSGNICSKCLGISTARSLKEKDVVAFVREVYSGTIVENDRSLIKPYELDIVLPELKVAIEFTGLFWHNEDRIGSNYHLKKLEQCSSMGYRLITLFEDEWEFQKDVVKARLRYILRAGYGETAQARKCVVREVETAVAREFCEHYHIQGYAPASIKFGLFENDRLVAVMTFSRPSLAKGHRNASSSEWELSRFCTALPVSGGASKLFKAFVSRYQPTKVITYSDRRWNTGRVYECMGFSFTHNSRPNYWYFKGVERIHRFQLRKTNADDPTLTEWENRKKQGWRRIFDCGNACYVWRP